MRIKAVQRGKKSQSGEIPVYLRIASSSHTPAYIATGIRLPKNAINKKGLIVKGANIPAMQEALDNDLTALTAFARDRREESPAEIKRAWLSKYERPASPDLYELFKEFKKGKDRSVSINRMKIYTTLAKEHLPTFSKEILLTDINAKWLDNFRDFLQAKMQANSAEKYLIAFNTFLKWCKEKGETVPIMKVVRTPEVKEVIFLTEEELMQLFEMELPPELKDAADMFLFSCFTGLRYSDVADFDKSQIKEGFIRVRQVKTGGELSIPLNKYAAAILERNEYQLPKIGNVYVNKKLKEIGKLLGLTNKEKLVRIEGNKRIVELYEKWELLTFHCGRSTFIMYQLHKGVSDQAVMQTTGHTDWKSFQRYVRFTPVRIMEIHQRIFS